MITLGARTDFSFMRGYGTPKQWLARCEEIGVEALAITDYCSTWGHAVFYDAFKQSKVKLIYGVQLPVVQELQKDPSHDLVTLLAKNADGLTAIYRAVALAKSQKYYRARLTWAQVGALKDVVVILNECSIARLNTIKKVKGLVVGARPIRDRMVAVVRDSGLPVVPCVVPVVPRIEDKKCFELFQAISEGARVGELEGAVFPLMRRNDCEGAMRAAGFEPSGEWFDLAARISKQCNVTFPQATKIKVAKSQEEAIKELRIQCKKGAIKLKVDLANPIYQARLQRELDVIKEKKFEDYFLFVGSLVRWAKERMFVGPGRGSSGGSLLCYLLEITTIDPIRYGTLFERFIDITRPDWPDIDVDFPDVRRDEVYRYLSDKFGVDHVARLGTVSEFGGKSAINDTAKAYGIKYDMARELGKVVEGYIVSGQQVSKLKTIFEKDPLAKNIIENNPSLLLAADIEDHARHTGVHAAGVVVTNEPVGNFGTITHAQDRDKEPVGTISMDMKQAEKIGMIKMDALGLRTLSVIQDVCDQVGIDPQSLYNLDFLGGDKKVFSLFNADRVTGVFQFEGHAVRQLMKQIKVETFDDLSALTSLARPGPLMGGAAALWCDRRSGQAEWDYKHVSLKPHTKATFGTIVYQEQAMSIVRDLGNFDEPAVNGFRRAIGKKLPEQLRTYRDQFLAGCKLWHEREIERWRNAPEAPDDAQIIGKCPVIPDEVAAELWDEMCDFGSYAFNLAHAVAYAMISYMAAHLKAYHPLEFAVANLRNASDDEQGQALLRELAEEGFEYVPFDPQLSQASWSIQDGKLVGGFDSVKGIGEKTAATLQSMRDEHGENWMDKLTESQRGKLSRADNTPWHQLTYFQRMYEDLYRDPENWVTEATPQGASQVLLIKDIPQVKGTYRFLGRIVKKMIKDKNSPSEVTKRGGEKLERHSQFLNIIFADDSGEIGTTVNRFKFDKFQWLLEAPTEGKDYLVRADCIKDGGEMRWLFIDRIIEITPRATGDKNDGSSTAESGSAADGSAERGSSAGEPEGAGTPSPAAGDGGSTRPRTRSRGRKAGGDADRADRSGAQPADHVRGRSGRAGATGSEQSPPAGRSAKPRVRRGKGAASGGTPSRTQRKRRGGS